MNANALDAKMMAEEEAKKTPLSNGKSCRNNGTTLWWIWMNGALINPKIQRNHSPPSNNSPSPFGSITSHICPVAIWRTAKITLAWRRNASSILTNNSVFSFFLKRHENRQFWKGRILHREDPFPSGWGAYCSRGIIKGSTIIHWYMQIRLVLHDLHPALVNGGRFWPRLSPSLFNFFPRFSFETTFPMAGVTPMWYITSHTPLSCWSAASPSTSSIWPVCGSRIKLAIAHPINCAKKTIFLRNLRQARITSCQGWAFG